MKKFNKKTLVFSLAVLGSVLCPAATFAVENYGMTYSGGEPLGSNDNVTFNPTIVDGLTDIMPSDTRQLSFGTGWKKGYMQEQQNGELVCVAVNYAMVSTSSQVNENNNLGIVVSSPQYDVDLGFKAITIDGDNTTSAIAFKPEHPFLYGSVLPFTDDQCTNKVDENATDLGSSQNGKMYVRMNIKIHKRGESEVFTSDELYFGLTDIDAGQSYKIMNSSNELVKGNMFAKSAEVLQPDPNDSDLKNMYVADASNNNYYIYSQYTMPGTWKETFDTRNISDIYLKLSNATQEQGLDIVFGFVKRAGSGLQFYAKQYVVDYVADEGGSITGITNENVIAGKNPSGSTKQPEEEYKFTYWTADVDVTLKDNTVIRAGEKITDQNIRNVVVHQDITFTAHFEPIIKYVVKYEADEGGKITGITSDIVESDGNPTGSKEKADDGYQLVNWTADVDVLLEDGTTVKAGAPLTAEQIKKVIVRQNITFTAHYKKQATPIIPDTGAFTKGVDAATIATISVIGILGIALFIRFLPQITHKKMGFKK